MRVRWFETEAGVEVPAVDTERMREIDRIAIEEVGPNLFQMMENAGRSCALTAIDMLGAGWRSIPIVVLAGSGGNGGGGICAARHLTNRGAMVTVVMSEPEGMALVTEQQLAVFRAAGGNLALTPDGMSPGLVVDALIGYGLGGVPRGATRELIEWAIGQPAPILSLDVPSGIDATAGDALGPHIQASVTLTLALPKTGLGSPAAGTLTLADIGIPHEVYRRAGIDLPGGIFGSSFRVDVRPVR
jgi:NAD(P)H-hydrate epimerase